MTKQEAFNKNWEHFIVNWSPPGFDATSGPGRCRYKSKDGRKCAIGILIEPGKYRRDFDDEFSHVEDVLNQSGVLPLKNSVRYDTDLDFLTDLQHHHDTIAAETHRLKYEGFPPMLFAGDMLFRNRYKAALERVAAERGLKVPA